MTQRDHFADIGIKLNLAGLKAQKDSRCNEQQQHNGTNGKQPVGNGFGNTT